jgi:hypothetical protein
LRLSIRVLLGAAVVSGGIIIFGAGAASAGEQGSDGDSTVAIVDAQAPVQADVCGTSVAVGGDTTNDCGGDQDANTATGDDPGATDNDNTVADVDAQVPVQADVCGTSVAVGGDTTNDCGGDQDANTATGDDPGAAGDDPGAPGEDPGDPGDDPGAPGNDPGPPGDDPGDPGDDTGAGSIQDRDETRGGAVGDSALGAPETPAQVGALPLTGGSLATMLRSGAFILFLGLLLLLATSALERRPLG